jgi:Domain of unknown function (DUF4224)
VFLTPDELAELSGWKRRKRQLDWLRDMGIPHYLRAYRPGYNVLIP